VEVRELLTSKNGKRIVYRFPYPTNDQQEIAYLLSCGATAVRTPVVLQPKAPASKPKTPAIVNNEPLKGGVRSEV
jgi:hypothetical protein